MLLSVTEVVSDTKTACGEQSLDRKSKLLTQDCLAFELSHIVGILLSIYYYGFITDAAHAALFASMLVFFYFDRGIFF